MIPEQRHDGAAGTFGHEAQRLHEPVARDRVDAAVDNVARLDEHGRVCDPVALLVDDLGATENLCQRREIAMNVSNFSEWADQKKESKRRVREGIEKKG